MLSPKVRKRKALLVEHGITLREIATEVGLTHSWVSQVVNGETTFETPNSLAIKRLIAERVGVPVAELWADEDASGSTSEVSTERAEDEAVD